MARNVAAFNLPARVGQLFGVSLERLSTSRAVLLTSVAGHTGNIARARSDRADQPFDMPVLPR
jgi:hypothetical protein